MSELGDDSIVSYDDRRKEFKKKLDDLIIEYMDIGGYRMLEDLQSSVEALKYNIDYKLNR